MVKNRRIEAMVDQLCCSSSATVASCRSSSARLAYQYRGTRTRDDDEAPPLDPATVVVLAAAASKQSDSLAVVENRQLSVSDLMMGTAFIASDADRSHPDDTRKVATVAYAIEQGITDIDVYPGDSELRAADGVSDAAARGVDTSAVRLHTKCDHTLEYYDFTAADALGSYGATMQRLGHRGANLYAMRIHDPSEQRDNGKGVAANRMVDDIAMAVSSEGHVAGLASLREQQKISQVSIGMMADGLPGNGRANRADAVIRLMRDAPPGSFDSALLAGGWNLLNQEGLRTLLEAQKRGIGVHNAAIFGGGLLVGGVTYLYSEDRVTKELRQRTDEWSELAEEHGLSLPAVAVAFAALPACVTKVVIGLNSTDEVDDALEFIATASRVPTALWYAARARGLLPPELPLPPLPIA